MSDPAKFSDDAIVRLIFAPMMLIVGIVVLFNYKRIIEYVYFRSQGTMPSALTLFMYRAIGAIWAMVAVSLLIGLW